MKPLHLLTGAALGVAAFIAYQRWLSNKLSGTGTGTTAPVGPPRNDAKSPRLPGMPEMPAMPSPESWAVPNMPAMPAMPGATIPPRTAPPLETGFMGAPDVFAGGPGWRSVNDWTAWQ